ncbi:MAG: tyrosine-type recombinase/integrase, partial [Actinomycetota bacterium]|nr:tyrosine-type recombinase/integrase [Actinomycetota bacterium]
VTPTTRENSWFDRALVAAGLPPMTIHDLRHTAASLAISAGGNVKAVQKMLGHASAAMTLDVYADLFDDDLDAVAARLDQALMFSSVGKMWANDGQSAEFVPTPIRK